jgi:hypothetical protein
MRSRMTMMGFKLTLLAFFSSICMLASPAPILAADKCDINKDGRVSTQEAISCGSQSAGGGQTTAQAERSINSTIASIVNLLSVLVAIIAVIMLIFGGFRYITSGGASDKVKGAKDTILYALIGLVIVALAQAIVRFVVNQSTNTPQCIAGKWDRGPDKGEKCP